MRKSLIALAVIGAAVLAGPVLAQNAAPGGAMAPAAPQPIGPLANTLLKPSTATMLTVTSAGFKNGEPIPPTFAQAGQGLSPPLAWTKGPDGTKSYVVLTEDAGAGRPDPITHWIAFNIPADVTSLPQGVPTTAMVDTLKISQGMNTRNNAGYMGMGAPPGTPHAYHFEVYALDKVLDLDPAKTTRNALIEAMKGHVLATGELVGLYARPAA